MSWPEVELMFAGIARVLRTRGMFALYGPFNRDGQFHQRIEPGVRRVAAGARSADGAARRPGAEGAGRQHGLRFTAEHAMPANNRLLVWSEVR